MSNKFAIISGVSTYISKSSNDLPFCRNDVLAMKDSLINGLKFPPENIQVLGREDIVYADDYVKSLQEISSKIEANDLFVLYFSGHGGSLGGKHYLAFSDKLISTQLIIDYIQEIKAKTKIIFLDSCYSGHFILPGYGKLNIDDTIEEFNSKGIVVFTSSNSNQTSHGHPDKPISVFTNSLCTAMQSNLLRRKGTVTLYDIVRFVSLYLELWNKNNPTMQQSPIYRGNIGGTVQFKVDDYIAYKPENIYEEYDNYIIYNVEPYHHALAKRLSVEVLLKEPVTLEELSNISKSIIERVKNAEIHQNKKAEQYFNGKPANIIWCYFANDENDITNSNFLCHTTWVDNIQDKNQWYKENGTTRFLLNDIHFDIHSFYDTLKRMNSENSGSIKSVIKQNKLILTRMVSSAEEIIKIYNEYLNDVITEVDLYHQLESVIPVIDEYYSKSGDIELPTKEISDFNQECQLLFATIHNLTLFYNEKYTFERSKSNRKACMDMTIKDYYRDLQKIRELENSLTL